MNKYDFLDKAPEQEQKEYETFKESFGEDKYSFLENETPTEQEQKFKQAQFYAKDKDPGTFAKAIETGKKFGVDSDFANRNLDKLEKEEQPDFKNLNEKSPITTSFLSEPENAAVAKDEIPRLQSIEDYYRQIRPYEPNTVDYFGDLGSAAKSGLVDLGESVMHARMLFDMSDRSPENLQAMADRINKRRSRVEPEYAKAFEEFDAKEGGEVAEGWMKTLQGGKSILDIYLRSKLGISLFDQTKEEVAKGVKDFVIGEIETAGEFIDYVYKASRRHKKGFVRSATQNLANSLPSIAGGAAGAAAGGGVGSIVPGFGTAAGAVVGGTAGMFSAGTATEVGAWAMQEADKRLREMGYGKNVTPEALDALYSDEKFKKRVRGEAIRKGLTTSGIDTLTTVMGGYLLKAAPKASFFKKAVQATKGVAVEMAGEGVSETGGQVAATGKLTKEAIAEGFREAMTSPFTGAIMSSGSQALAGSMKGVEKSVDIVSEFSARPKDPTVQAIDISEEAKVAQDSLAEVNALENIMNEVGESEINNRSPEKVKEFLGGEEKSVYVSREDFDEYFQSKGESPSEVAEKLGALEKYNSAPKTGQKIEVPLAEFVSTFAGVQEYKDLLMLVSLKPDAVNANEAFGIIQGLQENISKVSEEAKSFADQQKTLDEGERQIVTELYEQVKSKGLNIKKEEFLPIAKFFRTRAANNPELGLSPVDYLKVFGVELREGTTQEGDVQFDQKSGKEVKHIVYDGFDGEKVGEFNTIEEVNEFIKKESSFDGQYRISNLEVSPSDYHQDTSGEFENLDTEISRNLFQEYKKHRRKKNKTNEFIINGEKFFLDHESIKKNSYFKGRGISLYFISEDKSKLIRISDHWTGIGKAGAKSKKLNLSSIASSSWSVKDGEIFIDRLPGERFESKFVGGIINLKDMNRKGFPKVDNKNIDDHKKSEIKNKAMQRARDLGFDTNQVFYHATDAEFSEFNVSQNKNAVDTYGQGVYFAQNEQSVKNYGSKIVKAFVKDDKPIFLDTPETSSIDTKAEPVDIQEVYDALGIEKKKLPQSQMLGPKAMGLNVYKQLEYSFQKAKGLKKSEAKAALRKALIGAGFTSLNTFQGNIEGGVIKNILDPKNIRSVDAEFNLDKADSANIYHQSKNFGKEKEAAESQPEIAPIFSMKSENLIRDKMGNKATKEQVLSILKEVKQDELEFTGLREFIELQEGKINKKDVLNYIKNNGVKVVPLEKVSIDKDKINHTGEVTRDEDGTPIVSSYDEIDLTFELSEYDSNNIDHRNYLNDVIDVNYDSELDHFEDELREGRGSYVPESLKEFLSEKGYSNFEGKVEVPEGSDLSEDISVWLDSVEGGKYLKDYVLAMWGSGDLYNAPGVIKSDRLGIEVEVNTSEYGEEILGIYSDGGFDGAVYSIDIDNHISTEEFILQLKSALVENGDIIIDESLAEKPDEKEGSKEKVKSLNKAAGMTKWRNYTVKGAQNYREVLLTLPGVEGDFVNTVHFDEKNIVAHIRLSDRKDKEGNKVLFIEEIQSDWHQAGREKGYKRDLTREETLMLQEEELSLKEKEDEIQDISRQTIKTRKEMSDVVRGINNKVYEFYKETDGLIGDASFLNNIQRYLIRGREDYRNIQAIRNAMTAYITMEDGKAKDFKKMLYDIHDTYSKEYSELNRILFGFDEKQRKLNKEKSQIKAVIAELNQTESVPNAPFKQTDAWTSLALKRVMRMAAEEGYDSVGWTPAEIHQDRWGTDRISWRKSGKGFAVSSREQVGGVADGVDIEAEAEQRGELKYGERYVETKEELFEVIQDILNRERNDRSLKSLSDTTWDRMQKEPTGKKEPRKEGMETYYNKVVPKVATKIAKGLKTKPKVTELDSNSPVELKFLSVPLDQKAKEKMLGEGFFLFQENRGRIIFGKDRKKFIIELFDSADKSTFHHETGHLFLEIMNQLYAKNLLSDQERKDFEATLKELGVDSFENIKTEQHELFARMYERYLAEGKAPSKGLKRIFSQMKVWLISVYKDLLRLNAPVSEEMKNIFDRLIATQDEIEEANRQVHNYQLFDDPIAWGMSKTMAEKYKYALANAQIKAEEKLFKKHYDRIVKEEKKAWKDMYKAEQKRVAEIINDSVLYKAIAHLQKGKKPDGSELDVGFKNAKLDRDWISANYSPELWKKLPRGTTKKGGMDVELFASLYGFESADAMIISIANAPDRKTLVEDTAKQQLREREGDPLTSDEISDIAVEYVENEDKFKRMKMELDFLGSDNKTLMKNIQKKITARPKSDKQIREEARKHIESLRVDQIRPNDFRLAERRYAKQAGVSLAANDIEGAFNAKQNELISAYLYKFAREAKESFKKDLDWSKRIYQPDKKLAKTRDMDFVQAARAIMAQYGIGKGVDQNPNEMLQKIKEYAPDVYEGIRQIVDHLQVSPKPHTELSVGEYKTLMEGIKTLWGMSKEMREVEIKGERIRIEEASEEVVEQLKKFKKGKKEETVDRTKTKWEKVKVGLLGFEAKLRRFEFVVDALDLGEFEGPFRKYFYQPVSDATDIYKKKTSDFFKRIQELSIPVAKKIDHNKKIIAPEINFQFKNKGELLGALLHTGNDSNYRKLLLGYKWGQENENGELIDSNWKAFLERMYDEQVITKEDMDYIQALWDLIEEIKPDAQRAQKKIMGFYFDEIEASKIETPFGTYRGGYAPASIDMYENADIKDRAEFQEAVDATALNTLPYAGGGGFTKSRTNATRKLNLNIALVPQHFKEVLRYTYVKPAVIDAHKVLRSDEVTNALNEKDQSLIKEVIIPALNRADKDKVYTDDVLLNGFAGQWAGRLKTLASMQIFFLNIRNTVEQIFDVSSAKPLMPKGAKVMSGLRRYLGNVSGVQNEINELSTFMNQRNLNDLYEVQQSIHSVMDNVSKYQNAKDFMTKNAFITQSTMQNMIENSIWISSYEKFISDGLSSDEAVKRSDSIIRRSFGSKRALDISQAESSKMLAFFQMFMNWFNTKYNSNRAAFEKVIVQDAGFSEKTRALSYLYWMNFGIIAVGSEALRKVFAGTLDEDDDDEYLDDVLDVFVYSHPKMAAAMIPLFGPVANGVINRMDDKRWNDRMSATPALSMTAEAIGNPLAYITGSGSDKRPKQIKDALTTLGFATGAPLVPLAKPYKYMHDFETGKAQPSGPLDFMRGLVTGKPGKKD